MLTHLINGSFLVLNNKGLYSHNVVSSSTIVVFLSFVSFYCPGSMLMVNPEGRLSITELVNQLQEIAAARNVNPKSPITEVGVCKIVFGTAVKTRPAALDSRS